MNIYEYIYNIYSIYTCRYYLHIRDRRVRVELFNLYSVVRRPALHIINRGVPYVPTTSSPFRSPRHSARTQGPKLVLPSSHAEWTIHLNGQGRYSWQQVIIHNWWTRQGCVPTTHILGINMWLCNIYIYNDIYIKLNSYITI